VDAFEMAVRAIVGQQVSVASARTTLTRLIRAAAAKASLDVGDEADPSAADALGADAVEADASAADAQRAGALRAGTTGTSAPVAGGGSGLVGFPGAAAVADLPDSAFGMPVARRETIRALAVAMASGKVDLEPGADREEAIARLTELPGIGAWTAGYVAMRAIGDPDVFLPTDLAVRRGARALGLPDTPRELEAHAERWRPWRSYALIRLWRAG
jgi:AraC family transcriptional regulator of adaptative response / DNA-3-methyladenine glycosylase II